MNPLHLLKLEWKKYSPSGTFRFFAGLYLVFFTLVVFLARSAGRHMTLDANGSTNHPLDGLFVYPNNWQLLACIGSWMNAFVLGSLGVFMITGELSNRTLRQSVIFGLTRMEVAVSKLVWAAALAVAATVVYLFLGFGGEILDGPGLGLPPVECVLGFLLQALGYLVLGILAGFLMRQTALALLAYLAYVIFLETVVRWIFYFSVAKTRLLLFLPDQVLGALTPLPVPDAVTKMVNSNPSTVPLTISEAAVSAFLYLAVFALLFCRRIVKCDL